MFYRYTVKYKYFESARKFPGDFANFQKISRRENYSSRFPGVLDTLYEHTSLLWLVMCSVAPVCVCVSVLFVFQHLKALTKKLFGLQNI